MWQYDMFLAVKDSTEVLGQHPSLNVDNNTPLDGDNVINTPIAFCELIKKLSLKTHYVRNEATNANMNGSHQTTIST